MLNLGLAILGLIVGIILLVMYIDDPTWNVVFGVAVGLDFLFLMYAIYKYRKKNDDFDGEINDDWVEFEPGKYKKKGETEQPILSAVVHGTSPEEWEKQTRKLKQKNELKNEQRRMRDMGKKHGL